MNKISDVNAYLFEALDAITNGDLTEEELDMEIKRSKQITSVTKTIIASGRLTLDATKHADEYYRTESKGLPEVLSIEKK